MTTKLINEAMVHIASAAIIALPVVAMADMDMTNPVTDETKTYDYKYVGSGTWTASDWQDANGAALAAAPGTDNSNLWGSMLVNCSNPISVAQLNGWELQLGVFGGANVTVGELGYWTGSESCFAVVDNASSLTISATTGKNWNNTVKFYVANSRGITFTSAFAPANPNGTGNINYYLKGLGSVTYSDSLGGGVGHVIKQADVTLSGTSQVSSKTLVSFASTTKTFTADAEIRVYDTDGTTLKKIVAVGSVRAAGTAMESTSSILTTASPVGSCEIVQCTDGIVLYYVDGDYPSSAAYKPSISVNFCHGNAPLITSADVGYGDYAVPGMFWNNMVSAGGNDGTFTTPLSTIRGIKSTGEPTLVSGASVAVSGTRGSWSCGSVAAAKDLRQGYVDDAAGANASPQVAISGIPYYSYYAVVYFSNNDPNVKFGYVTINGTNYKWDNDTSALVECTGAASDMWGTSSPTAWTEGGNYIVTPTFVNSDGSFTIVSHRLTSGGVTARSGIAAIQIVEVPKTAGEGELVIDVSGDTTYTVDANATYTTVYATGTGTLSFSGSGVITTTTFNIGNGVTMPMDATHLSPTTVTGSGTVVYDGVIPPTDKGWTDSANWKGTVWVKNKSQFNAVVPGTFENTNSTLRLTGVSGYFNNGDNTAESAGTLELVDDGDTKAFTVANGFSRAGVTKFAKLAGDGTLTQSNHDIFQRYVFTDSSAFTGNIDIPAGTGTLGNGGNRPLRVILGDTTEDSGYGTITIASGATATIAAGKTWNVANKIVVDGTLNVNGTLASDSTTAAVSGSGMVVFTGRAPTPTGDTWWKNSSWTGTVQMKDVTNLVGASNYNGTNFLPVDYGNTGSVLELYNCSGWLPNNSNYQCTVPLKVTGTLTINNGISGSKFVISSLSGSGTIYTSNNSATTTLQVLEASGFTGKVQLNSKRIVFGETLPSEYTVGNIYVGEGFSFTVPNSDVAWYGTGGITLAGELKAAALSNFGGGTTITTTDTGVFTLVSNSNTDDMNVDYTRIQGTGTLKYEGTNYRTISTNNFPTALVVENNLSAGLIHRNNGQTVSIGSLSGSGQMRSDWNGSGSTGDRDLRILQAKDTTYSGLFASTNDRIDEVYVAPGASTAGTLTLSGVQTASNGLVVESGASVNLTGTWVGATTVSGTIGGTGTLTGDLTFNAGSTFKAFASDGDGLSVSGTIAYPPESGTVAVDVSAMGLTDSSGWVTLITASGLDESKFAPSDADKYKIRVVGNQLQARTRVKKFCVIVR